MLGAYPVEIYCIPHITQQSSLTPCTFLWEGRRSCEVMAARRCSWPPRNQIRALPARAIWIAGGRLLLCVMCTRRRHTLSLSLTHTHAHPHESKPVPHSASGCAAPPRSLLLCVSVSVSVPVPVSVSVCQCTSAHLLLLLDPHLPRPQPVHASPVPCLPLPLHIPQPRLPTPPHSACHQPYIQPRCPLLRVLAIRPGRRRQPRPCCPRAVPLSCACLSRACPRRLRHAPGGLLWGPREFLRGLHWLFVCRQHPWLDGEGGAAAPRQCL